MKHAEEEIDNVSFALGEKPRVVPVEAERTQERVVMGEREEAQGDRAHQELAGIDPRNARYVEEGSSRVETLDQALVIRRGPANPAAVVESGPLEQPNVGWMLSKKVDVGADSSTKGRLWIFPSQGRREFGRQRTWLGEGAFEHRLVQLALRAEGVARHPARDSSGSSDVLQRGPFVAALGKERLRRAQDRVLGGINVPHTCCPYS